MAITLLERAVPREREPAARGSALPVPVWVEPARPATQGERGPEPGGVVIALPSASRAAVERPLRLTRRGRLTLTLATVGCVLAITGLSIASAATSSPPAAAPPASIVVAPGDTIWEVAQRADPQADPRVTVARIIELNELAGGQIRPGQRLLLPAS